MVKTYTHLQCTERSEIFRLRSLHYSYRKIATLLERSIGTIGRELTRNTPPQASYEPILAQEMAQKRHWRGCKIGRLSSLKTHVEEQLAMERSPEQISGRLKQQNSTLKTSHESIYRYVYSAAAKAEKLWLLLPYSKAKRGRRVQKGTSVGLIKNRIPIAERPEIINNRSEFGHWEGDLMQFSKKGEVLVVMTERQTRLLVLSKQVGKTAQTTLETMQAAFAGLAAQAKKSITFDNGLEFAKHTQLGMATYFCQPHSPWEKGTVENAIGRLRLEMPRKIDITRFTQQDIQDRIDLYNDTPRKVLKYLTPYEAFQKQLNLTNVALRL